MELKKNDIVQIQITGMTSEGNGVGRHDNFALFIPNSAVGDILNVKIVKLQKSYGYAIIDEIVTPSPDRIEQDCKVASQCGGCAYRHISYESECTMKQQLVQENLKKLGGIDIQVEPIIPSPQSEHYRNKAQYPVGGSSSDLLIGFYANRSHRIINCDTCSLQPEIFTPILQDIRKFIEENYIVPYDEENNRGILRHIYIRMGEKSGEIMVCLIINHSDLPFKSKLISLLTEKYPQIKSIVLNINKAKNNVILGAKCITIYGTDTITDTICGLKFQISPLSFYQVNRQGAENLYSLAKEFASPKKEETIIDLYCGTGTLGLTMAREVNKLIGVEIIEDAIKNAWQNAELNNISNAEFIYDDAKGAALHFVQNNVHADTVIIDPPRKGCEPEVLQSIVEIAPQKIVMVSCNSATMARDCKYLIENGYTIEKVRPVDMFPRTVHVECVVLMSRVEK